MLRFKRPDGNEYPVLQELHMKDITTEYNVRNKERLPLDIYSVNNEVGFLPQSEQFDDAGYLHNTDTSIYMIVPNGYFAYNPARIDIGSIGYQNTGHDVQVSSLYVVFNTFEEVDDEYLWHWFHTNHFRNSVHRLQEGGVRLYYYYDKLEETTIALPCLEEQQKIADCLSSVDAVIADYESQVENMQNQKKGVMQKLFSQEVRFKADDGSEYPEWEGFIFKDGFETMKNNTLSRDCFNYEGGQVKNIHYGDVLIKFGAVKDVKDKDVPFVNSTTEAKGSPLKNGDIIFADTAEDTTAGKATEIIGIEGVAAVSGLHTIPCRPIDEYAEGFLGYYFNSYSYRKQLIPLMQGTKVTSINRSNIENSKVCVPCLEEQQKIADCLTAFDDTIEDLQKTVEHWKNIKKGLLQQLFA